MLATDKAKWIFLHDEQLDVEDCGVELVLARLV